MVYHNTYQNACLGPTAVKEQVDRVRAEKSMRIADPGVPLARASHAPGFVYESDEILAIEKQRVFLRDWLCVARVEEFERAGDYQTFDILGERVLIARDEGGTLHASLNMCAHRGVAVATGAGNARNFRCPYHAWTYDLTGQLIHAPFMKGAEGFRIPDCRLRRVMLGEWAGWVFINFDETAEPLADFVAPFEQDFACLRQQDCRLALKVVNDWACNWKYVVENLMDVYHVGAIHMASFAKTIRTADFPFDLRPRGGFATFTEGRPLTPDGKSLLGPLPWMADRPETFACYGYLAPNLMMLARQDFVRPTVIWPLSPDRTRTVSYILLSGEQKALPGLDEKLQVYVDFIRQIVEEDKPLVQALQQVAKSSLFVPGRLSELEKAIHHMGTYHAGRIASRPSNDADGAH
ncbi:MAG: aromatic ring-hydroxylating dioxygenase subunit alpha [Lautropia sp.]